MRVGVTYEGLSKKREVIEVTLKKTTSNASSQLVLDGTPFLAYYYMTINNLLEAETTTPGPTTQPLHQKSDASITSIGVIVTLLSLLMLF